MEVELRRRGEQSTHKWTHLWMVLFELRLLPSLYLSYIHVIAKVHESHLRILPTNRVKLPILLELKSTIPATVLQTGRDEKKGAVPVPILLWQKRDERVAEVSQKKTHLCLHIKWLEDILMPSSLKHVLCSNGEEVPALIGMFDIRITSFYSQCKNMIIESLVFLNLLTTWIGELSICWY